MEKKGKVVPMGTQQAKPSYEELEKKFMSLVQEYNKVCQQAQQMAQELQKMNSFNIFKRLDYLFKVVESEKFGEEFTAKCIKEIVDLLTIPEQENTPENANTENNQEVAEETK